MADFIKSENGRGCGTGFILFLIFVLFPGMAIGMGWTDKYISGLPDSSFAAVEKLPDGTLARRCPYRDAKGNIDPEQLIYVLGTFSEESWNNPEQKEIALKYLKMYYDNFLREAMKSGIKEYLNINAAKLTELVLLPRIGPVLAVKIIRYRENISPFKFIEDIKKIEGIGQGTFNGLRHYIRVQ